ncbi:acyl-CoA synthetase FdrA [Thorsellia kenyensis]|uniref:Acyl-CoA synthetase FdrA n=1 Tax=Thorsellia kenyensis TaxID=1549888 RepID=A0ABV6C8D3_9GAMM
MSVVKSIVLPDTYRDSVFLMKLSVQAKEESGAEQISAMMATQRNKELYQNSGLLTDEISQAKPDDLAIAVKAPEALIESALAKVKELLNAAPKKQAQEGAVIAKTIAQAMQDRLDKTTVLISCAGDYAAYEAAQAVSAGCDVVLYSDNISLEKERALKELARSKGLLVMGPDCGTAIIDSIPFAFANTVGKGSVGVIGASGTGLQEVTCLLDRLGVGISQAFGTGGRDLKDDIGGITAISAFERLLKDEETKIIGILGKPPGDKTRAKLIALAKDSSKPVAVHFLGAKEYDLEEKANIPYATNLTEFSLLLGKLANTQLQTPSEFQTETKPVDVKGKYIRGLFSGGTLCQESAEIAGKLIGKELYSNLSVDGFTAIKAGTKSIGNCFWDFGEDEFTVGRPHPMMAPELRMEHLVESLLDEEVGVVLADMVIGFGAADGQAETFVNALKKAQSLSSGKSLEKLVVLSVCGTEKDTPARKEVKAVLEANGVHVFESNALAANFACQVIAKNK